LEAETGNLADRGPAIEEGFVDTTHLGDVGMDRNPASVWQNELEMVFGMAAQRGK
jgi:hypothetical protein